MRVANPKIIQPVGRPTVEQLAATTTLYATAQTFQQWQLDNNKIATGKSVNSWTVVVQKSADKDTVIVNLRAVDYIYYDLFGRGPGKWPPVEAILDWMLAKPGFRISQLSPFRQAYAIAHKISLIGTQAPKMPQSLPTSIVQINTRTVTRKAAPLFADQEARKLFEATNEAFNQAQNERSISIKTSFRPAARTYTLKQLLP
jgi:hypothetical protein